MIVTKKYEPTRYQGSVIEIVKDNFELYLKEKQSEMELRFKALESQHQNKLEICQKGNEITDEIKSLKSQLDMKIKVVEELK